MSEWELTIDITVWSSAYYVIIIKHRFHSSILHKYRVCVCVPKENIQTQWHSGKEPFSSTSAVGWDRPVTC